MMIFNFQKILFLWIITNTIFSTSPIADTNILLVPEEFNTIQEAINVAKPEDTILVNSGIYYENLYINKEIKIRSKNGASTTVLDGNGLDNCLKIYNEKILLDGFTITNSGFNSNAILLINSNDSFIENNIIKNANNGISVMNSNNTIILNNIIYNNVVGINIIECNNTFVKYNQIFDNIKEGIIYNLSINGEIFGNSIYGNDVGIGVSVGYNNKIYDNIISKNFIGIETYNIKKETFDTYNFIKNLKNESVIIIHYGYDNNSDVALKELSKTIFSYFINNKNHKLIFFTTNEKSKEIFYEDIVNNYLIKYKYGINWVYLGYMEKTESHIAALGSDFRSIFNKDFNGTLLDELILTKSINNILSVDGAFIFSDDYELFNYAIRQWVSPFQISLYGFFPETVEFFLNEYSALYSRLDDIGYILGHRGIFEYYILMNISLKIVFFKNNFIGNTIQALDYVNISWNQNLIGNYWSDYVGKDINGDGIGDTNIPYKNLDSYPLMQPKILNGALKLIIHNENDEVIGGVFINSIYTPGDQQPLNGSTKNDGSIVFSNIIPGTYNFEILKEGYEKKIKSITVFEGEIITYTIKIKIHVATLKINVKDNEGKAIEGVFINSLYQPEYQLILNGTTNNDGQIIFQNVKIGNYTFKADKEGYESMTFPFDFSLGAVSEITVSLSKIQTQETTEEQSERWIIPGFPNISILISIVLGMLIFAHARKRTLSQNPLVTSIKI